MSELGSSSDGTRFGKQRTNCEKIDSLVEQLGEIHAGFSRTADEYLTEAITEGIDAPQANQTRTEIVLRADKLTGEGTPAVSVELNKQYDNRDGQPIISDKYHIGEHEQVATSGLIQFSSEEVKRLGFDAILQDTNDDYALSVEIQHNDGKDKYPANISVEFFNKRSDESFNISLDREVKVNFSDKHFAVYESIMQQAIMVLDNPDIKYTVKGINGKRTTDLPRAAGDDKKMDWSIGSGDFNDNATQDSEPQWIKNMFSGATPDFDGLDDYEMPQSIFPMPPEELWNDDSTRKEASEVGVDALTYWLTRSTSSKDTDDPAYQKWLKGKEDDSEHEGEVK